MVPITGKERRLTCIHFHSHHHKFCRERNMDSGACWRKLKAIDKTEYRKSEGVAENVRIKKESSVN